MSVVQKGRLDDLEEARKMSGHIKALVNMSGGSPQKVSDAIIQIIESSSESREVEPEVIPELEEENFHIDSTGWEEKVGEDGIRYKINPEGDVTELLDGPYAGEQHFLTPEAALRETQKAEKRMPDDDQWEIIIKEGKKRAAEQDMLLYEALGLKLAGGRDWSNGQYYYQGRSGYYWSSSPYSTGSYGVFFYSGGGGIVNSDGRGYGRSIRCLKN